MLLSNLFIVVSLIVSVEWLAVNLLISSAFEDILFPKPQFVIILIPSKTTSQIQVVEIFLGQILCDYLETFASK